LCCKIDQVREQFRRRVDEIRRMFEIATPTASEPEIEENEK